MAPLIELGAGFDPNLTARENIFLNGCVLGHTDKYMREHFDEIVDFAELHQFLDSPIKNYSSGMKARLGFAVATMLSGRSVRCVSGRAEGKDGEINYMCLKQGVPKYITHCDAIPVRLIFIRFLNAFFINIRKVS